MERIKMMYYQAKIRLSILVGMFVRRTTTFRFSKDYRWGVTFLHRAVYATICTFLCNLVADGETKGDEWL